MSPLRIFLRGKRRSRRRKKKEVKCPTCGKEGKKTEKKGVPLISVSLRTQGKKRFEKKRERGQGKRKEKGEHKSHLYFYTTVQ